MSAVFRSLVVYERQGSNALGPFSKREFDKAYFAHEGFTLETAEAALSDGDADSVAFGERFLANPDLPKHSHRRAPLTEPEPETLYAFGPQGYIDYPMLLDA